MRGTAEVCSIAKLLPPSSDYCPKVAILNLYGSPGREDSLVAPYYPGLASSVLYGTALGRRYDNLKAILRNVRVHLLCLRGTVYQMCLGLSI